ncbi:MAG: FtsW/RodA/SpoVE family cell cycle protein, partial [Lentisphaerae bacterium]|nr:FtsW/RodA/SpoVE family cell cycle protein [Lentisphaerota bacterium]
MFILARSIHDKVTAGVQSIRRCVGGAGRMHVYFRLVALLLALGGAGCLLIQSATRGMASQSCFSRLQMVWLLFGLIFLSACFLFPRSFYKRHLGVILGLIYALLWGVLVFGVKIQGARSWYRFHGFCMQPSELAKPAFLVAFAWFWKWSEKWPSQRRFAAGVLFAGLWMLPIMLQPDWGTTMIYALTTLVLLYCLGMNWRQALAVLAPFLAGIGWALVRYPYVRRRFMAFLGTGSGDLSAVSWQAMQMRDCLIKGGWTGGLFSEPSSFVYVPYRYNDSIFAAAAELLGVAGVLPLILLCLGWVGYCCYLAGRHASRWTYPVYLGAGVMLSGQAFVHLAVNLGMMPTTGINLPLISYGGSSLLTTLLIIGLVERCAWEDKQEDVASSMSTA